MSDDEIISHEVREARAELAKQHSAELKAALATVRQVACAAGVDHRVISTEVEIMQMKEEAAASLQARVNNREALELRGGPPPEVMETSSDEAADVEVMNMGPAKEQRLAHWPEAMLGMSARFFADQVFAELLDRELGELRAMLIAKNQAYGNSALDPVRCFSKASTIEQLNVRIDDKISRLMRGHAAGEDVDLDLLGYLVLRRMAMRGVSGASGRLREAQSDAQK